MEPEPATTATVELEPIPAPPSVAAVYPLDSLRAMWAAEAEAAHEAAGTGTPRGPVTGFPTIDKYLGGYLTPGIHALHGEPGSGKTNFALQVASRCQFPALFVSTEMSPLVLMRRIVARTTSTFLSHLDGGEFTAEHSLALFDKAAETYPQLALVDATREHIIAEQIREVAEAWRDLHKASQVLIVIDSLHTWAGRGALSGATEYEALNDALADLLRLAHSLHSPVLVVAERNRIAMGSTGQSAAKGSAKIEYSAETIMSLNRSIPKGEGPPKSKWQEDAAGEYHVYVDLAKNRNGGTGHNVNLRFHGATASLREAKKGEA